MLVAPSPASGHCLPGAGGFSIASGGAICVCALARCGKERGANGGELQPRVFAVFLLRNGFFARRFFLMHRTRLAKDVVKITVVNLSLAKARVQQDFAKQ